MSAAAVLDRLSGALEWAVLFDLPSIREHARDDVTVRGAFGLPPELELDRVTHVALTSGGPYALRDGKLEPYASGPPAGLDGASLGDAYAGLLGRLDVERAACIGLGRLDGYPPVVMAVELDADGAGRGEALFAAPPSRQAWELLAAVGVRPVGDTETVEEGALHRVRFAYSLSTHLEAARLGKFARTASCNRFFLRHGELDGQLGDGLVSAARDRLAAVRQTAFDEALDLAEAGLLGELAPMTAVCARRREPYGDTVPLALLLAALGRVPSADRLDRTLEAVTGLRALLRSLEHDGGWAFHRGTVTTGLDSALVLLGLRDPAALDALERFREPSGGYSADRTGEPGPSTVAANPATAHWRGPDLATTALVRALRRSEGLPATPAGWFSARFAGRSSVFVANPWLLDWLLALALEADPDAAAAELRSRLAAELLAGRNEDGSFGGPDERVLATASAVLALHALGVRDRRLALAQLALAGEASRWRSAGRAPAVPFVSSVRLGSDSAAVRRLLRGDGVVLADGEPFELTLYEDTSGAVAAALVALALSRPGDPADPGEPSPTGPAHLRYRCDSIDDYVARVGLRGQLANRRPSSRSWAAR